MSDSDEAPLVHPQERNRQRRVRFRNPVIDARKYAPLYCFLAVPIALAMRIKLITESGRYHTGKIEEIITLSILYIPAIIFTFYYPIKNFILRIEIQHGTLASFALRLLTSLLAVLFIIYELAYAIPCIEELNNGSNQKDICSLVTIIERFLELLFLVGVAIFVFFNKHYPRENKYHLFNFAHLCSGAAYLYILTVVLEEIYIFEEIQDRYNSTEEYFMDYRVIKQRGLKNLDLNHEEECHGGTLECLLKEYLEMFYVAISEFLVVAISITIALIFEVGKNRDSQAHSQHHYEKKRMIIWTAIVLVAVGIQIALIILNVQKADNNWVTKLIFTVIHVFFLSVGTFACVMLYNAGNQQPQAAKVKRSLSESLDRYLLYFGTAGMLFYTMVGIVHSSYLIPTEYSTEYALGSLLVNVSSLFQVLAQTATILHRDMIKNSHGYWAGIMLWIVNFVMFCLDLFDAATLGIYSNPVPHDANVIWTMFVRGLGPFDVFYRFHSLAVIAENIEHHLARLAQNRQRAAELFQPPDST